MKPGKLLSASAIPWIVIILALILLYATYFLVYIPRQEAMVEQRGFRILKEYASNMDDKYDYYKVHLQNYGLYYIIRDTAKIDEPEIIKGEIKGFDTKKSEIETLIKGLDTSIEVKLNKSDSTQLKLRDQRITIDDRQNFEYYFKAKDLFSGDFGEGEASGKDKKSNKDVLSGFEFSFHVPVSTLMDGLKFDMLLDNIVLFDSAGVMYNSNNEVVYDITNTGAMVDSVNKHQGGIIQELEIRGEDNHVMILPIDLKGKRFYLAGFISGADFSKKTRAINNQLLIILSGLMLLILIGMPVLKIIFIGKREQIHPFDASSSTISLIVGTGFFVLIVLSVMKYYVVDRHNLDRRLDSASITLSENVEADFEIIKGLYLKSIDTENHKKDAIIDSIYTAFNSSDSKSFFAKLPDDHSIKYLPLNEVFLIDSSGIMKKAVTSTGASSLVPTRLEYRKYFKYLIGKESSKSWILRHDDKKVEHQPYYIESIKSYNSLKQEAAFSFLLPKNERKKFGAPIMAITSPVPSLYNQVLPDDISFMIINDMGDVLFHSRQNKNLHENFLTEADGNSRLEGSIRHRIIDKMTVNYNEKTWLCRVVPIKAAPLYHVTLIDMEHTQNKNARILVFTFYFLIATFVLIIIGMGVFAFVKPKRKSLARPWSYSWLLFNTENHNRYVLLFLFQLAIIVFQLSGLLINDKPVTMFVYQLIFILISVLLAVFILGQKKQDDPNIASSGKTFTLILSFVLIVLAISLLSLKQNEFTIIPVLHVLVIFLLMGCIFKSKLDEKKKVSFCDRIFKTRKKWLFPGKKNTHNIYLTYMFLWLLCLSVLPALQYYHSVKTQEGELWDRSQLESVARKNLLTIEKMSKDATVDIKSAEWYKRIQGRDIDFMQIHLIDQFNADGVTKDLAPAERIYAQLRDPVIRGSHTMGLLKETNNKKEWSYKNYPGNSSVSDSIVIKYLSPGQAGAIKVSKSDSFTMEPFRWVIYFIIPIVLVGFFIWAVFNHVGRILLGTVDIFNKGVHKNNWSDFFKKDRNKRILLTTFSGKNYFEESEKLLNERLPKNKEADCKLLSVEDLIVEMGKKTHPEILNADLIWINDFEQTFNDPEKLDRALQALRKLSGIAHGKIVMELPFGYDYVYELFDEKLADGALGAEEKFRIKGNLSKLKALLKNYTRFIARLIPLKGETIEHLDKKKNSETDLDKLKPELWHGLEMRYHYIWDSLNSLEKLVLHDLATDGMLNPKNMQLVNELEMKGLITFSPRPQVFSTSFRYFLLNTLDQDETRLLETQLRRKGKWANMRYLILIILIPLLGFVLIAQGTSIEKVIGIFTGALALLSGLLRLTGGFNTRQAVESVM